MGRDPLEYAGFMPNTAHVDFEARAIESVLYWGKDDRAAVVLVELLDDAYVKFERASMSFERKDYNKTVLYRANCAAPAPYVARLGTPDPFLEDRGEAIYHWPVWVDDRGRHVAGDAYLLWRY